MHPELELRVILKVVAYNVLICSMVMAFGNDIASGRGGRKPQQEYEITAT